MTTLNHFRRSVRAVQFLQPHKNNVYVNNFRLFLRNESSFVPKRILIVVKLSRYYFEKIREPNLNEEQFKQKLKERGSDYDSMMISHLATENVKKKVTEILKKLNIEYKLINRKNLKASNFAWADLILPIGGDGTFLLASNMIFDNKKPIIGINSCPEKSEGYLMSPMKYTESISEIFEMLRAGYYKVIMRRRIRTTIKGDNIWDVPFHTHEKGRIADGEKFYMREQNEVSSNLPKVRRLPWLALNEVFIAETLSAKTSSLLISIDDENKYHLVKSSGLCITTGTGSTSWYKSINSVNPQIVQEILTLLNNEKQFTNEEIDKICSTFNNSLYFDAEESKLCYVVRDMIVNDLWPVPKSIHHRKFCNKLTVRSQCYDASIVLDGGIAIPFNFGATAIMETYPEDSLRSLVLD
ncbi:NAD kinase 2, mitochondrial-like isoform X1 [Apis dorsata]|uniref:NAD kinase 2, mitochondrial-like isoform X1 n=2 Tax=Apis dorsata TaxID=7462 RepID=UPI0003DF4FEE|nr:NAD kinase 2, mitochondrial-like isoform X1 [Apis dorsata]